MIFIKNRQEELCRYTFEKLFTGYTRECINNQQKELNAQELIDG